MFPITHLYFSEQLTGGLNTPMAFGSIFPDSVVGELLTHEQTHQQNHGLLNHFRHHAPELLDVARGILTHGISPAGIDYYSDEKYQDCERGYCFEKARYITPAVIECCRLPIEMGWWKAHNFIEMSIELTIATRYPHLLECLHRVFADQILIHGATQILGNYYRVDGSLLAKSVNRFAQHLPLETWSATNLAQNYARQMMVKHQLPIDIPRAAELIEHGCAFLDDLDEFFSYSLTRIAPLLEENPNN